MPRVPDPLPVPKSFERLFASYRFCKLVTSCFAHGAGTASQVSLNVFSAVYFCISQIPQIRPSCSYMGRLGVPPEKQRSTAGALSRTGVFTGACGFGSHLTFNPSCPIKKVEDRCMPLQSPVPIPSMLSMNEEHVLGSGRGDEDVRHCGFQLHNSCAVISSTQSGKCAWNESKVLTAGLIVAAERRVLEPCPEDPGFSVDQGQLAGSEDDVSVASCLSHHGNPLAWSC